MSGGAPAADAAGNLYVITGNGIFDGTSAFGDSFLKLSATSGLALADWFTPMNQLSLDAFDQDLGAGGAAVLVDQTSGPHPHLIIGGGKSQVLYLLDRTNMGHFTSGGPDKVVQTLNVSEVSFSTPAFWQNTLYFFGFNGPGLAYTFLPAYRHIQSVSGVFYCQLRFRSQVLVRRSLQTGTRTELCGRLTRTLLEQAITDQRARGLPCCTPSMLRI